MGLCSGSSRLGGIAAVGIMMLASVSSMLPFLMFGLVGLLAGNVGLLLQRYMHR